MSYKSFFLGISLFWGTQYKQSGIQVSGRSRTFLALLISFWSKGLLDKIGSKFFDQSANFPSQSVLENTGYCRVRCSGLIRLVIEISCMELSCSPMCLFASLCCARDC